VASHPGPPGPHGPVARLTALRELDREADAVEGMGADVVLALRGERADDPRHQLAQPRHVRGEHREHLFLGHPVTLFDAGVGVFRPVQDLTLEEWRSTIDTNLSGAFYCSREALFRFVTRGGGYIVNINSLAGANAFAGGAAYNASKFGLTGFTEAMMQDVRSDNVRVSTVMPGSVATEFSGREAQAGSNTHDGADWKIWPEDVAEVVRMLLKMPTRTLVSRVEVRPAKTKIASKR